MTFVWIDTELVFCCYERQQEGSTLLTPWCRVLLEKLTGLQLVKKFPAFHGTRKFITALTSVHQLSLSWASPIQSIHPHPTSWRSILILSTHLRLGHPSGLLSSGFPSKTIYTHLQEGKGKSKAVPLQGWIGPEGSRKLRLPDFVTTAQDGGRLSALRTGRLYPQ